MRYWNVQFANRQTCLASTYLIVELDIATTIGRKQNLVANVDLGGDMLAILVKGTLTGSNDITFVEGFLGLLGNQDASSSFLQSKGLVCGGDQ